MDEEDELRLIREKLRAELMRPRDAARQAPRGVVDIGDADLAGFVKENPAVLVDVWAPWCGPCRVIGPMVEELAQQYAGRVAFAKMNADDNPAVMQAYRIQGIPTLLLFRDGKLVDRVIGVAPKLQLAAAVDRLVGRAA